MIRVAISAPREAGDAIAEAVVESDDLQLSALSQPESGRGGNAWHDGHRGTLRDRCRRRGGDGPSRCGPRQPESLAGQGSGGGCRDIWIHPRAPGTAAGDLGDRWTGRAGRPQLLDRCGAHDEDAAEAASHFEAVEIIERHHSTKPDAPSGTALATAMGVAAGGGVSAQDSAELVEGARGADVEGVRVHAVRLPGLISQQEVVLSNLGEVLSIEHLSTSYQSFASGALIAIRGVVDLAPGSTSGSTPSSDGIAEPQLLQPGYGSKQLRSRVGSHRPGRA